MRPTEAFFAPTRKVKLEEAAGEIIAEMVSPYPPGIPRLIPGERVTETILDYLSKGRDAGMFVLDPKGEIFKLTSEHRSNQFGHRIVRFDPDGICGPGGDAINPLASTA